VEISRPWSDTFVSAHDRNQNNKFDGSNSFGRVDDSLNVVNATRTETRNNVDELHWIGAIQNFPQRFDVSNVAPLVLFFEFLDMLYFRAISVERFATHVHCANIDIASKLTIKFIHHTFFCILRNDCDNTAP
jgi:hypothetical protein